MKKYAFHTAFAIGILAIVWVAAAVASTHLLVLVMTALIGAVYLFGGMELRQYRSTTAGLQQALAEVPEPEAGAGEIKVRMEAAPINPSDLAILTSAADFETAEYAPGKVVATMPEPFLTGNKARHGQRLPAGNEGAGTVIAGSTSTATDSSASLPSS